MSTPRTYESMVESLNYAKLDISFTSNIFQSVKFDCPLLSEEYKLIEVPDWLADEVIQGGENQLITLKDEPKSNNKGRVFACISDKTFSVVEAETSNTLLIASSWWLPSYNCSRKDLVLATPIQAIKNNYFELQQCSAPSLKQLRLLLASSLYYGPVEDESDSDHESFSTIYFDRDTVEARLPCSKMELTEAFRRLRICEINGYVRILDPEYITRVVKDIFAIADENGWDWRTYGFPLHASIEGLRNQHQNITKQVMMLTCAQLEHRKAPDSKDVYVYPRNSKICQVVGEHLLSVISSFDLNDFLRLWKASVPNGLRPKLRRHLTCAGRAYCEITPLPLNSISIKPESNDIRSRFRCISLLRSEDLPDDSVETRLRALFERCSMWPEPEIGSFITEMLPPQPSRKKSSKHCVPEKRCQVASSDDISYADSDSDSDFCYEDIFLESTETVPASEDVPMPTSAAVCSLLNKFCRVNNSSFGRILTQRHSK
ncbi:hypothetical protein MN116_001370 [Schistosoma mekongi]|uniref:Sister chromatid cohesion protein DCC1 n=1 Tax=Schistosoma mekongi TaxID=38744 RepID=A0AAE2D962_SCHME|nr:hypothetical protein MN116_001370 [Schistosoma mekongi]